ncbi:hypothetical protein T06_12645 [Trichinella sp. T6]|nr:hypothetical protein T06_12645 [Trichinella sp. T6]
MQADRNTANIRSFYSVTNNQRKALRRQQRTASQNITGRNNSTRNRCQGIYKAQPPMSGSIKADNLAIFVGDPNHH